MIEKLISGGRTGVDRAALAWGLAHGYQIGVYVTRDYASEDGAVPLELRPHLEAVCSSYPERTRRNVATPIRRQRRAA